MRSWKKSERTAYSTAPAASRRAAMSPDSLPNESISTQPSAEIIPTAPRAKPSAAHRLYLTGSSSTRSAPFSRAVSALANLSQTAASPRCVKSPLITETIWVAPSARVCSSWNLCPWWNGLYSQITAAIFMA